MVSAARSELGNAALAAGLELKRLGDTAGAATRMEEAVRVLQGAVDRSSPAAVASLSAAHYHLGSLLADAALARGDGTGVSLSHLPSTGGISFYPRSVTSSAPSPVSRRRPRRWTTRGFVCASPRSRTRRGKGWFAAAAAGGWGGAPGVGGWAPASSGGRVRERAAGAGRGTGLDGGEEGDRGAAPRGAQKPGPVLGWG